MNKYTGYCQEQILKPGSSIYYALLHLETNYKHEISALIAFMREIKKTTSNYKEISIAKTKIKWWQNEINNLYQHKPTHPISFALETVLKKYTIPQQLLNEYLEGAILKLETDHFCTEKDIVFFSYREYGLMLIALSYVLSPFPNHLTQCLHKFSETLTRIDFIQYAQQYSKNNKQIFSLEMLDKNKINHNTDISSKSLQPLFIEHANIARQQYLSALKDLTKVQKNTLKPLLIFLKIKIKLLQEIENDGFNVYQYYYQLTPIRKYFIAKTQQFLL
ncbi:MAG: hypothetical protein CMF49_06695 [Legionellales bacterium]|nr:hypothetical protein [Legionellales bacterium]|tara:strand:+ start:2779 stop:3606 length:828 start_codon:yes stop_codon:yes gene_type:complete